MKTIKTIKTIKTFFKIKSFFLISGLAMTSIAGLCLASCTSTINNHENDYIHQVVSDRPAPVTPSDLQPIKTSPVFVIPAGANTYPAQKSNVNLKPPTLSN